MPTPRERDAQGCWGRQDPPLWGGAPVVGNVPSRQAQTPRSSNWTYPNRDPRAWQRPSGDLPLPDGRTFFHELSGPTGGTWSRQQGRDLPRPNAPAAPSPPGAPSPIFPTPNQRSLRRGWPEEGNDQNLNRGPPYRQQHQQGRDDHRGEGTFYQQLHGGGAGWRQYDDWIGGREHNRQRNQGPRRRDEYAPGDRHNHSHWRWWRRSPSRP